MLVSSKSEEPAAKFTLTRESDKARGILVSYEETAPSGAFIVRNEMSDEGGKLTFRSSPLDMKILDIINKENIKSVEDYARWLKNNFKYKRHEENDIWTDAGETLDRRYGDCKDLSLLNAAFLRVFGYRPRIFAMERLLDNHAVCVFEKDGRYLWFDNTSLKNTLASSSEEFKRYLARNNRMSFLYEVNPAETISFTK
jgi:hypothetical protein